MGVHMRPTMAIDSAGIYSIVDLDSGDVLWTGNVEVGPAYRALEALAEGKQPLDRDAERTAERKNSQRKGTKPGRPSSTRDWEPPEGLRDELRQQEFGTVKLAAQWLFRRGLNVKQISVFLGIRYQHAYQAVGGPDGLEVNRALVQGPRCRRCGRLLTDIDHIAAGIGPNCAVAESEEQEAMRNGEQDGDNDVL